MQNDWGLGQLFVRQLGVGTIVCEITWSRGFCVWDNWGLVLLCVRQLGLGTNNNNNNKGSFMASHVMTAQGANTSSEKSDAGWC